MNSLQRKHLLWVHDLVCWQIHADDLQDGRDCSAPGAKGVEPALTHERVPQLY